MTVSKWIITKDGAMLKSEISVIIPVFVAEKKTFTVVVVNKQGVQLPVLSGIESSNGAIAVMNAVIHEIEKIEEPTEEQFEEQVEEQVEEIQNSTNEKEI